MKPADKIRSELRQAVRLQGGSCYSLARRSGIADGLIHRFAAGGDVTLDTAQQLARACGMTLTLKTCPKAVAGIP